MPIEKCCWSNPELLPWQLRTQEERALLRLKTLASLRFGFLGVGGLWVGVDLVSHEAIDALKGLRDSPHSRKRTLGGGRRPPPQAHPRVAPPRLFHFFFSNFQHLPHYSKGAPGQL